jgi:hypothetical protein
MCVCRWNVNVLEIVNEIPFASQQVQNTTDRLKLQQIRLDHADIQMISYAGSNIGTATVRYVHSGHSACELLYRLRTVVGALLRQIDMYLV